MCRTPRSPPTWARCSRRSRSAMRCSTWRWSGAAATTSPCSPPAPPASRVRPILFLDEAAVRRLLRYEELIPAIERALSDLSGGRVVQPVRVVVPVADHKGFFGVMPAYAGALGAKLVTFYPANTDVHTHHAVIAFF